MKTRTGQELPCDFVVGEVYKMYPADRSHMEEPYYVKIIEIGDDYIITHIPNKHSLKISSLPIDSENWTYHIPRMERIGIGEKFKKLLYDQKLILNGHPY